MENVVFASIGKFVVVAEPERKFILEIFSRLIQHVHIFLNCCVKRADLILKKSFTAKGNLGYPFKGGGCTLVPLLFTFVTLPTRIARIVVVKGPDALYSHTTSAVAAGAVADANAPKIKAS